MLHTMTMRLIRSQSGWIRTFVQVGVTYCWKLDVRYHQHTYSINSEHFDTRSSTIIRTEESRAMGAKFINDDDVSSAAACMKLCCDTSECDVFVFEEKVNIISRLIFSLLSTVLRGRTLPVSHEHQIHCMRLMSTKVSRDCLPRSAVLLLYVRFGSLYQPLDDEIIVSDVTNFFIYSISIFKWKKKVHFWASLCSRVVRCSSCSKLKLISSFWW